MKEIINFNKPVIFGGLEIRGVKIRPVLMMLILVFVGLNASIKRSFDTTDTIQTFYRTDTVKIKELVRDTVYIPQKVYPIKEKMASLITAKSKLVSRIQTNYKKSHSISITDVIKDKKVLNFICHNEVLKRARKIEEITGIKTSLIIAQKGLESAWGTSKFTNITKCLGNIKCVNKKCKKNNIRGIKHKQIGHIGDHCVQLYDDKWSDRFVRYSSFGEGWKKYLELMSNKRYKSAGKKLTYQEQIRKIGSSGYATDPNYASKTINIMKKTGLENLQKYIDEGYTITTQTGKIVLLESY